MLASSIAGLSWRRRSDFLSDSLKVKGLSSTAVFLPRICPLPSNLEEMPDFCQIAVIITFYCPLS